MAENVSTPTPEPNFLTQKVQENPVKSAVALLLITIATTVATSIGTTKGVAAGEVKAVAPSELRIAGDNIFATKQEKEEIWRYLADRRGQRDKDFDKIEKNMVTKAEFQMLMDQLNRMERKIDERPPVYRSQ